MRLNKLEKMVNILIRLEFGTGYSLEQRMIAEKSAMFGKLHILVYNNVLIMSRG
jgi:hypothetical protein